MELLLDFLLTCAEIVLILFMGYILLPKILELIFKNHTATYRFNKKDFKVDIAELSTQKKIPDFELEKETGIYTIKFGTGRGLKGGIVRIYSDGHWYSSIPLNGEKKLELKHVSTKKSEDELGKYNFYLIEWELEGIEKKVQTNIYQYYEKSFIIFEQKFLDEFITGIGKFKIPITQFPCFKNESPNKNILLFRNAIFSPPSSKNIPTSGPVMHYDDNLQTFIISSMNNFLVNIINETKDVNNYITCGLEGEIEQIPKGYSQKFILYFGTGINKTFEEWGDILLKYYDRKRNNLYNDPIISYLGYWTDNGAHYYYKTMKGKNYQETLEALFEYFKEENIPIRYFQLDSWHYKKSWGPPIPFSLILLVNGILDWSINPKHFPDFDKFREKIGDMPFACHSRYFHPNNVYTKKYKFYISNQRINKWGLPAEIGVWDEMMKNAKKKGVILYEQDWMRNQFLHFKILRNNVYQAKKWLSDMNESAKKNDMWIQYCMATPGMFMHSLEFERISYVRTGEDYNARFPLVMYFPHNSETAILAYAVGVWPFIDCFISNKTQGPFYKSPFPDLLAVQAIMSCGPVGPGDKINYIDRNLILKTCRDDGLLLKPDKPATPIDLMFKKHATYYITKTYSRKDDLIWYYLQIVNIWPNRVKNKDLTLKDFEIKGPRLIYDFWEGSTIRIEDNTPLHIELKKNKYKLLIIAPIIENKIAIIGNIKKFITCSNRQFPVIKFNNTTLEIIIEDIKNSLVSIKIYSEINPKRVEFDGKELIEFEEQIENKINHWTENRIGWIYNKENKIMDINVKFNESSKKKLLIKFS
ncbi:MAG: hypothetical protein ACTSPY_06220 [Candidatus Helarchaeota archaeon]